jgi:hypothetical protein
MPSVGNTKFHFRHQLAQQAQIVLGGDARREDALRDMRALRRRQRCEIGIVPARMGVQRVIG